eukprot:g46685.t1
MAIESPVNPGTGTGTGSGSDVEPPQDLNGGSTLAQIYIMRHDRGKLDEAFIAHCKAYLERCYKLDSPMRV